MIIYLYKKVDDIWVQQAVDATDPTTTTYDINQAIALAETLFIDYDYVVGYGSGHGPSMGGNVNKLSQIRKLFDSNYYQVDDWDLHNLATGTTRDIHRALSPAVGGGSVYQGFAGTFTVMSPQPYWATVSNAEEII